MTISLFAQFDALPGNEAFVVGLIADFAGEVRAEAGNISFDPYTTNSGASIFVIEEYEDHSAFEAHLRSAHGLEFNRRLGPLIAGGASTLTMLERIQVRKEDAEREARNG